MFPRPLLRSFSHFSSSSLSLPISITTRSSLRRHFTSQSINKSGSKLIPFFSLTLLAVSGAGYYYFTIHNDPNALHNLSEKKNALVAAVSHDKIKHPLDYHKVAKSIADILDNNDYDDGSFGPLLVRLAWHASGTYSKADGTGGSNGATMRYGDEASDGANNGLDIARKLLEPIKQQFPDISYADLWTLAGVVAIKEMGGPSIPWRSGRTDAISAQACPPVGRLPDASKDRKHIRNVFNRMGFDDREIVALLGAHALGRCHPERSGFTGPWTFSPISFTNDFYNVLLNETWVKKQWDGPLQYEDKKTQSLMMLPTDMELYNDRSFYKYTKEFAQSEEAFFQAFSQAFKKLLELGVQFPEKSLTITL